MPGISEGLHAKMSMFARRKLTSTASYLGSRVVLMLNAFPFGSVGSRGYKLDVFRGLKVAGVALGVGGLIGQTVEVRHQGR
jgi:hypothetical protein